VGDGGLLGRVFGGTGDGDLDRGAVLIKCSGDSSFAAAASSALGFNLPALGMNWVDVLRVKPYLDTQVSFAFLARGGSSTSGPQIHCQFSIVCSFVNVLRFAVLVLKSVSGSLFG
jgi:hypothetical protein